MYSLLLRLSLKLLFSWDYSLWFFFPLLPLSHLCFLFPSPLSHLSSLYMPTLFEGKCLQFPSKQKDSKISGLQKLFPMAVRGSVFLSLCVTRSLETMLCRKSHFQDVKERVQGENARCMPTLPNLVLMDENKE